MLEKILISVGSALATAFAFWLIGKLVSVPQDIIIPSGAVVAFNTSKCPEAWERYAAADGRSIVGIAEAAQTPPGQQSGSNQVVIQPNNLPQHQHDTAIGVLPTFRGWGQGPGKTAIAGASEGQFVTALSSPVGEVSPTPIRIEPPMVALRYCVKK